MAFLDAANVFKSARQYAREQKRPFVFDYERFVSWMGEHGSFVRAYYYDGAPHRRQLSSERARLFASLRSWGYTLRLKEIDPSSSYASQKGVDIALTSDMISLAYEDAYDVAIIASGDGDYESLVHLVKSKGKLVWVLSFSRSLSWRLRESADRVILIDAYASEFSRST
jgi:uncharacterized LabA/DUF88 family protein